MQFFADFCIGVRFEIFGHHCPDDQMANVMSLYLQS